MICVGYVGCEAFDIVLYIGRTLTKLNYRVLVVDLSNTGALNRTIKHGMGLDSKKDIVNYRDINYTRKIPSNEELVAFKDGVVFVVFASNYEVGFPVPIVKMNIVVNTYPNIIEDIDLLTKKISKNENSHRLLVRDIITLDDVERVKNEMELTVKLEKVSYLYLDIVDYENAVNCQLSQVVKFVRISKRMKKYITEQIRSLFPKIKLIKIKKAIRMAKRGS